MSHQPPNVIQIISDQHHAGLMGCAGHPQAITPNLDRLADEGIRFDAAYAQNPICTPSRVSALTGQYCQNHGYFGLTGPRSDHLKGFLGHFRHHGYRTAAFGKLHQPCDNGGNWLLDEVDRLADSYENGEGQIGRSEYFAYLEGAGVRHLEDSMHNPNHHGKEAIGMDARPSELPYEHTQERWCVDEAFRFIDRERDEAPEVPFCLQIAFQKPHHPLLPQKAFWDIYPEDIDLPPTWDQDPAHRPPHFRRTWQYAREYQWPYAQPGETYVDGLRRAWRGTLACISQIDDVIGRLLAELENRSLRENTIVVYHSDHGCYHGIHGIMEKAPGICSDAVCRVPMIWSAPGLIPAGENKSSLAENIDLGPTLASLCGLPAMDWADGRDLAPIMRGESESVRDAAVTENPWSKAIRFGKWRFVYYPEMLFDGEDVGELYDLEADPDETRNLYHDPAHREQVEQCRRRLLRWMVETKRHVTVHPALRKSRSPGHLHAHGAFHLAADGRETNADGPAARKAEGRVNYL